MIKSKVMNAQASLSKTTNALHPKGEKFIKDLLNPIKQSFFMFLRLPGAWFFGMKVTEINEHRAVVTLPYGWRSQNPFRSIYFAAQCAAGEMSTGVLAMLALQGQPKTSMLVSEIRSEFTKKANTLTTFTCENGQEIMNTVQKAIETKEAQTFMATSIGRNKDGDIVSKVYLTWTFKVKG